MLNSFRHGITPQLNEVFLFYFRTTIEIMQKTFGDNLKSFCSSIRLGFYVFWSQDSDSMEFPIRLNSQPYILNYRGLKLVKSLAVVKQNLF